MSYDNLFWGGKDLAGVIVPNHTQWRIKVESLLSVCDIFHPTTDKRFPLGAIAEARDGRRWRYCENGGSILTKALIFQHAAGVGDWQKEAQTDTPKIAAVDDKSITVVVTTTAVAGDFIDAYLTIEDEVGQGDMYIVKDNETGTVNATTGFDVICHIADAGGVRSVTSTATFITLTKSIYKDVLLEVGSGFAGGVNHVDVPADSFFWGQTRGPCAIVGGSSAASVGNAVIAASGKVVILSSDNADTVVGTVIRAGANSETALINLSIE